MKMPQWYKDALEEEARHLGNLATKIGHNDPSAAYVFLCQANVKRRVSRGEGLFVLNLGDVRMLRDAREISVFAAKYLLIICDGDLQKALDIGG